MRLSPDGACGDLCSRPQTSLVLLRLCTACLQDVPLLIMIRFYCRWPCTQSFFHWYNACCGISNFPATILCYLSKPARFQVEIVFGKLTLHLPQGWCIRLNPYLSIEICIGKRLGPCYGPLSCYALPFISFFRLGSVARGQVQAENQDVRNQGLFLGQNISLVGSQEDMQRPNIMHISRVPPKGTPNTAIPSRPPCLVPHYSIP